MLTRDQTVVPATNTFNPQVVEPYLPMLSLYPCDGGQLIEALYMMQIDSETSLCFVGLVWAQGNPPLPLIPSLPYFLTFYSIF